MSPLQGLMALQANITDIMGHLLQVDRLATMLRLVTTVAGRQPAEEPPAVGAAAHQDVGLRLRMVLRLHTQEDHHREENPIQATVRRHRMVMVGRRHSTILTVLLLMARTHVGHHQAKGHHPMGMVDHHQPTAHHHQAMDRHQDMEHRRQGTGRRRQATVRLPLATARLHQDMGLQGMVHLTVTMAHHLVDHHLLAMDHRHRAMVRLLQATARHQDTGHRQAPVAMGHHPALATEHHHLATDHHQDLAMTILHRAMVHLLQAMAPLLQVTASLLPATLHKTRGVAMVHHGMDPAMVHPVGECKEE